MARLGIFAIVILVIGFFAYIDINAYKLGFAPPSQRVTEIAQHPNYVIPHQSYRHNNLPGVHADFGTPIHFQSSNANASFKAEFGQPRDDFSR
ncbi:MAG: hypothetical protein K2X77_33315 [Candidatus Obscuribacterales bacterium]|jgi:hypothetical protein|nr:hypothetical protein [Candidatus Obscuribacterales bacterium]